MIETEVSSRKKDPKLPLGTACFRSCTHAVARIRASPSLKGRLLRGTLWVTAGSAFARLIGFATTIILARMLGKEAFGEYGMVRSTIDVFAAVGTARMGTTATKYVSQYRSSDPAKAGRVLAMSLTLALLSCLLMAGALACTAPWLAAHSLHRPSMAWPLVIGALFMFFTTYAIVMEFALSGFEAFRKLAFVYFLRGILMPLTAIGATYAFGLTGLLAAISLNAGLELLLAMWLLRSESIRYRIHNLFSLRAIKQEREIVVHFALPGIFTSVLLAGGIWQVNALFVNHPEGYASLGLFNAANQWKTLILFLPGMMAMVIIPLMSGSLSSSDTSRFSRAASLNLRANIMIALPLAVAVIVFRTPMMQLFGERFRGSDTVLPALMVSAFACTLTNTVNNTLTSAAKRWFTLTATTVWAVTLCALIAGEFVPATPNGLASAYAISYCTYFVLVAIYTEHALPDRLVSHEWRLLCAAWALLLMAFGCSTFPFVPGQNVFYIFLLILSFCPLARAIHAALHAKAKVFRADVLK